MDSCTPLCQSCGLQHLLWLCNSMGRTWYNFLQAKSKPGSVGADAALKCLFRGAGVGKRYQDPGVPKSTEFYTLLVYHLHYFSRTILLKNK